MPIQSLKLKDFKPRLSIIIPFTKCESLVLTLESLANCRSIEKCEVIVIGDGVPAHIKEVLESIGYPFDLKVMITDWSGKIGMVRNTGVELSISDTLYFIDSDCCASIDLIENINRLDKNRIIRGRIDFFGRTFLSILDAEIRRTRYDLDLEFAYCPNLIVRRSVFDEIGKFDPRFRYGSDGEFALRVRRSERKVFYDHRILIRHDCTASWLEICNRWVNYGEGRFYRIKKHGTRISFSDVFPNLFDYKKSILYNFVFLISNIARAFGFLRGILSVKFGHSLL